MNCASSRDCLQTLCVEYIVHKNMIIDLRKHLTYKQRSSLVTSLLGGEFFLRELLVFVLAKISPFSAEPGSPL
jgi:hypothetical protein